LSFEYWFSWDVENAIKGQERISCLYTALTAALAVQVTKCSMEIHNFYDQPPFVPVLLKIEKKTIKPNSNKQIHRINFKSPAPLIGRQLRSSVDARTTREILQCNYRRLLLAYSSLISPSGCTKSVACYLAEHKIAIDSLQLI
jgi:hypothetical protein